MGHGQLDSVLGPYTQFQESIFTHLTRLKIPVQVALGKLRIGRTGGVVCKVSYSLARATVSSLSCDPRSIRKYLLTQVPYDVDSSQCFCAK
jgi:hypothetical protein